MRLRYIHENGWGEIEFEVTSTSENYYHVTVDEHVEVSDDNPFTDIYPIGRDVSFRKNVVESRDELTLEE